MENEPNNNGNSQAFLQFTQANTQPEICKKTFPFSNPFFADLKNKIGIVLNFKEK